MGKHSKISYCDSSWSPWIGCTPISEACEFCYAEAWAKSDLYPGRQGDIPDHLWRIKEVPA